VIEKILTGVIGSHRKTLTWAKWKEGKGKNVQYLINKWIIYNKTLGGELKEVVSFHIKRALMSVYTLLLVYLVVLLAGLITLCSTQQLCSI